MLTKQWTKESVEKLYEQPFLELIYHARTIHKQTFTTDEMELCTLANIKMGACPEDCAYCTQSGHYKTGIKRQKLLDVESVLSQASVAKENGAQRFCMGAAWRNPPEKDFPHVLEMIKSVKAMGLETCVTLGMLTGEQAYALKEAGLDFYNHNLDTSPDYYEKIITTHTYQDRLNTLEHIRQANIQVCCGGIIGMGESRDDRIALLVQLANLPQPPSSVPINQFIPMKGTPLEHIPPIDHFEFIRTIAAARIILPKAMVRLSAGRDDMSDEMQALCFFAGANSIFFCDKLLTANNPDSKRDLQLLKTLGIKIKNKPHQTNHHANI
ncbi:MAG: biotin synthase BioB [Gammaproteobacteria bacterium RIFCSPHIGHO2_12_FULL_37_34]|nr:MAG: biotin synthase BioB [Gammaproteobacteria bacterium RIFCSPHIGHO2_12_FULL_37_34]